MRISKLWTTLASAAFLLSLQLSTPTPAHADIYQIDSINIDNAPFYGLASTGQVVLDSSNGVCGSAPVCYGSDAGWSGVLPSLTWDNGTGCTPSSPAGLIVSAAVCNNGRVAYYGYPTGDVPYDGLYTYFGTDSPQLIYSGPLTGGLHMNGVGDIVFDDGGQDLWDEAIDLSNSPAPTPEPSTLLLLSSGILALGLTVRRRLVLS